MSFTPEQKIIINLAPTGMVPTKEMTPHVPITPEEIAADTHACYEMGATILHLHARDENGAPTWKKDTYARIIGAVREKSPEAIICVSCSGRNWGDFERRSEVLELTGDVKPDMASLTLGSMNFPKQASVNEPDMIRMLAQKMNDNGILPELEVFDLGMIDYSRDFLIPRGIIKPPFYYNILFGSLGTMSATPGNIVHVVNALPPNAIWSVAGIGRFQFYANSMSITMGGNIRIGLEDNLHMDIEKTTLATNPALVERIVGLIATAGREIATPEEARAIIGFEPQMAAL